MVRATTVTVNKSGNGGYSSNRNEAISRNENHNNNDNDYTGYNKKNNVDYILTCLQRPGETSALGT